MAEEDLIFSKNRHFFGGIEPSNMLAFSATVKNGYVVITATLPNDTVLSEQTLCTVEGALIRRKMTGYPTNEFDGELVIDLKESSVFTDVDASADEVCFYSAFPYTTQGVFNRNKANRAKAIPPNNNYVFGYDLVKATSNPSERVSYPSDVDNADFTPASMNYDTGVFDYGGWAFEPGEKFMPRPCMLTYAGTVDHYLDPSDYGKKMDGTESSVSDSAFGGNAMMEWPKIFTKRWEEDGVYHFRCSGAPQDEDWDCWCNYDRNNNQISHFYTPIYFGSLVSNKLRSLSGQANSVSKNAATEISYAVANGDDWYTEVLADRLLLQDLLVMMARTTECQTAFGFGVCSASAAILPGTMDTKGLFWGANDKTSGVKVFGMENVWGNLWRRTAGWINDNGTQKVKLTRGTHDGSTATDYNITGSGYVALTGATPNGSSGGYISNMKTTVFGRIPVTASGSSSTFEADGLWFNNAQVDYAIVGGYWSRGLVVGPFSSSLDAAASYASSGVGAALSCKPLAAA